MRYSLGCFRDKEDKRDYIYLPTGIGKINFPESFRLKAAQVKDQGDVNSCVAHSIATIKEIQELYETGSKMTFSVGWIYGYRVGNQYRGEGMYPREALNNLIKYGDVLKSDFPENMEYSKLQGLVKKRQTSCLNKGKEYKCKAYARVISVNDVKSCIYINHSPVMIVCDIYDSFYKTSKSGIVPKKSGNNTGSHAMTIVGWKKTASKEYWVVQNSWGKQFADSGYCYIEIGSNIITDLYTVTDLKNVKR